MGVRVNYYSLCESQKDWISWQMLLKRVLSWYSSAGPEPSGLWWYNCPPGSFNFNVKLFFWMCTLNICFRRCCWNQNISWSTWRHGWESVRLLDDLGSAWMCPWESGVHDKTKEDESAGRERGVRVAADLVWTAVSSAVDCSLPAAQLGDRQWQTGSLLLFNSSQNEAKSPQLKKSFWLTLKSVCFRFKQERKERVKRCHLLNCCCCVSRLLTLLSEPA